MASGGRDRSLHIWEEADGKKKGEISGSDGEIFQIVVMRTNLFTAGTDKIVRQYALPENRLVRSFSPASDTIYSLAFDGQGQRLAAGTYDGMVKIWKMESGELEQSFIAAPGFQSTP